MKVGRDPMVRVAIRGKPQSKFGPCTARIIPAPTGAAMAEGVCIKNRASLDKPARKVLHARWMQSPLVSNYDHWLLHSHHFGPRSRFPFSLLFAGRPCLPSGGVALVFWPSKDEETLPIDRYGAVKKNS